MSEKPWKDRKTFEELWEECDYSIAEMARRWDITIQAVAYWRDKYGLEKPKRPWHKEENLRELYHGEEMTLKEVAIELGTDASTVQKWMERNGIDRRKPGNGDFFRKLHPNMYIHHAGYVVIEANNGYDSDKILLHRLLAVSEFGFGAIKDKDVHHKNGVPWDNRPDNLELLTRSEHTRLHQEMKD